MSILLLAERQIAAARLGYIHLDDHLSSPRCLALAFTRATPLSGFSGKIHIETRENKDLRKFLPLEARVIGKPALFAFEVDGMALDAGDSCVLLPKDQTRFDNAAGPALLVNSGTSRRLA
jgi:hypothetical protein